ncbi:MAG: radical SAM protein [Planctomycetes bacterium]|nr:radical SAM protein [Planctomycetota bacterium]
MQTIRPQGTPRGRVLLYVPRWLPPAWSRGGLPYRVVPVLSALARRGYEVRFLTEVQAGLDDGAMARGLAGADAAVVWCAELNPGVQIAGVLGALRAMKRLAPQVHRVAGGGLFSILPPAFLGRGDRLGLDELVDQVIRDDRAGALARYLDGRAGVAAGAAPARRLRYEVAALRRLDLAPFLGTAPSLFGNHEPALQIPTGYGCAKHCPFCFYERTRPELLGAEELVGTIAHVTARYGVRQYLLGELDFFASVGRVDRVVRGICARGLAVRWFALASPEDLARIDDAGLDRIAAAGCHTIELGTEAGSSQALVGLGKRHRPQDALALSHRLLARGIVPMHNILFGYVGETRAHRRASLALVRRLAELDERVRFTFRLYQAIPDTTMGDVAFTHIAARPRTFEEIPAYRARTESGRALPWLTRSGERHDRLLTEYLLAMAYEDPLARAATGWRRRLLRLAARARLRLGFLDFPLDRALFRRFESVPLPDTYLP